MGAFEIDVEVVTKGIENEGDSIIALLNVLTEAEDAPKDDIAKLIEHITKAEKAKPDEVEEMSKATPELVAAIKAVVTWMKKMAGGPGAPKDAITMVATFLGKVAGGTYPSPKSKAQTPEEEAEMKKAKAAEEEEEKKKAAAAVEEEEKKKVAAKKAAEDSDGLSIRIADGEVFITGQQVTKAKKFTTNRTTALKETAIALMKLVADVDAEAAKEIQEAAKELPLGANFASQVQPTGTAAGAPIKKDDPVVEKLTGIEKRLEKMETERPVTKSLEDEGGTDNKGEVKKSLWGNVL